MPTTKNLNNLVTNKVVNEDIFRSMLARGPVRVDGISFTVRSRSTSYATMAGNLCIEQTA